LEKKKFRRNISLFLGLKSIPGIGITKLFYCFQRLGISTKTKISKINMSKLKGLSLLISKLCTYEDLKFYRLKLLNFHRKLGTYRGVRMRQGLPRNGQRSHSNAGTTFRLMQKADKVLY